MCYVLIKVSQSRTRAHTHTHTHTYLPRCGHTATHKSEVTLWVPLSTKVS